MRLCLQFHIIGTQVKPCKCTIPTTIQGAEVKQGVLSTCHFQMSAVSLRTASNPWGTLFTWELLKWSRGITPDWLIHLETRIIVFLDMPGLSLVSLGFNSRIPMVGCIIGAQYDTTAAKIRQHVEWMRKSIKNRFVTEKKSMHTHAIYHTNIRLSHSSRSWKTINSGGCWGTAAVSQAMCRVMC